MVDTTVNAVAKQNPFELYSFVLIKSDELGDDEVEEMKRLITEVGGDEDTIQVLDGTEDISPRHNLMVVSETCDFGQYSYLDAESIPIVRPAFIQKVHQMNNLIPPQPFTPNPKNIFKDVSICCSGLSNNDKINIYAGVQALGGHYSETLTNFTTHVVSPTDKEQKCVIAAKHGIKVVLPHWVDHCLKLARYLDDKPYLFPDLRILSDITGNSKNDQVKNSESINLDEFLYYSGNNNGNASENISNVFEGKKFFVSRDILIDRNAENESVPSLNTARTSKGDSKSGTASQIAHTDIWKMLSAVIKNQQGIIVDDLEQANVYVGQFRDGEDYRRASKRRITVGSVAWVYWMIQHQKWTYPQKLLHYPEPRKPIPGGANLKVTITNFQGNARNYIERLVSACGMEYTKTLRPGFNTHLIAAMPFGMKYAAAKQNNIHVVNSLWLEESYAMWELKSESNQRYTTLPDRVDLTEVLNQTILDSKVLARFYESPSSTPLPLRQSRSAKSKASESLKEQGALEYDYARKMNRSRHSKKHELPALEGEDTEPKHKKRKVKDHEAPSSPPQSEDEPRSVNEEPSKVAKKGKTRDLDLSPIYFITTGLPQDLKDRFFRNKKLLDSLDIYQSKDVTTSNILVASSISRTANFLRGMAIVDDFVTPGFLEDCIKGKTRYPVKNYRLGSKFKKLERALQNRQKGPLFKGLVFNFTDNPECIPFYDIVRDHGGGTHLVQTPKRGKQLDFKVSKDGNKILIATDPNNKQLAAFKRQEKDGVAFTKDFIVQAVLACSYDLDTTDNRL